MASDPIDDVTSGRTGVSETSAPLTGLVVVELGHSVAAPYAGQILGDLGAEVIKIEKPDGDDARKCWFPMSKTPSCKARSRALAYRKITSLRPTGRLRSHREETNQ